MRRRDIYDFGEWSAVPLPDGHALRLWMNTFERLEKRFRWGGDLAILRAVHQEDASMGYIESPIVIGVQNLPSANMSIAQGINPFLQTPVHNPEPLPPPVMPLQTSRPRRVLLQP